MKHKKIMSMVLCAVMLILYSLPNTAFAAGKDRFTFRVGYWQNYGIAEDASGKLSGYIYDYMQKIAELNNWDIEFISCTWSEGMEALANGTIDTFGPLQKTPEREQYFAYPDMSMGYEYGTLYARKDDHEVFYNDVYSLQGKILGTVEDNFYLDKLLYYCRSRGVDLETKVIDTSAELEAAFESGEVDLYISGSMLLSDNAKIALQFSVEEVYFPTTKGNVRASNGINYALSKIKMDNLYYDAELYNKHYLENIPVNKGFTSEERKFIDTAPIIKIGYEISGKPTEYFDEETGTAKGINIDLLGEIASYSGLQFEYVPTSSFEHAKELLANGEIQLVSGLVYDMHFKEMYGLQATQPFFTTALAFITKQGSAFDEAETILALPETWVGIRHHMEANYPAYTIKVYETEARCLDAVLNGEATLTVENTLAADNSLKLYQYQPLTVHNMTKGDLPICLGAPMSASPVLMSVLNKSIASISANTLNQVVYEHTIGIPYEPSFTEKLRYNAPVFFVCICMFFMIVYFISASSRKELNKLAYYDELTGEMNLNKFKLEVQKVVRYSKESYGVMVLDIDKFKSVNDLYGYDYGDQMLQFMSKELHSTFHAAELVSRGAADKFYLMFKWKHCDQITEEFRLMSQKAQTFQFSNKVKCKIALSGGVCEVNPGENNILAIIDRANIASKQIKHLHTSRFEYYDQSMYDKINREKMIENSMNTALANHEFIIYLQPKIELSSRKIVGAEALVRWIHPTQGLIAPGEFIPLFEENGFVVDLDYYVLEHVCQILTRWKQAGRELFTISVNLSRRHLQNLDTVETLCGIVSKHQVDPKYIEIELTESAFDNCDIKDISALFDELHSYGFTVSVDDFGAGYSSLSLLKDLPIDVLKIDKSFFGEADDDKIEKMWMLLESVISLSRKLNIKTVSEGVETQQQVHLLLQLGCDLVQGFYFARPMPADRLEMLLDLDKLYDYTDPASPEHDYTKN